jgi:ribosome-binding protein aMBF1 (putative translation factor)
MADIRAADEALAAIEAGEETIPGELVQRLFDGASPVRVWREHRGLSVAALALESGADEALIHRIEAGEIPLAPGIREHLAAVLKIDVDDLDPWPRA